MNKTVFRLSGLLSIFFFFKTSLLFSQVTLSTDYAKEDEKNIFSYWQSQKFLTIPFAIMYDPITKKSSFTQLLFDSTQSEFITYATNQTYFTKINKGSKKFTFMSIESKKDTFSTIGYYIDKNDGNLVLLQLNCDQSSFKTTKQFYSFVESKLPDSNFLKPYMRLYNRNMLEKLNAPQGYKNLTNKLKKQKIGFAMLKSDIESGVYVENNENLAPQFGKKFSLITFVMPNRNCPPCQISIERVCKKIDTWKKTFSIEYKVIVSLKKNSDWSEIDNINFRKELGNKYLLYFDEDYKFATDLGVKQFPFTILVNDKGEIIEQFRGDYNSDELPKILSAHKTY